jgi:hypothetical protein
MPNNRPFAQSRQLRRFEPKIACFENRSAAHVGCVSTGSAETGGLQAKAANWLLLWV